MWLPQLTSSTTRNMRVYEPSSDFCREVFIVQDLLPYRSTASTVAKCVGMFFKMFKISTVLENMAMDSGICMLTFAMENMFTNFIMCTAFIARACV